jgi:hypothetical protein
MGVLGIDGLLDPCLRPAGAALAVSISLHPAGRFAYTVRLRRRSAGSVADTG